MASDVIQHHRILPPNICVTPSLKVSPKNLQHHVFRPRLLPRSCPRVSALGTFLGGSATFPPDSSILPDPLYTTNVLFSSLLSAYVIPINHYDSLRPQDGHRALCTSAVGHMAITKPHGSKLRSGDVEPLPRSHASRQGSVCFQPDWEPLGCGDVLSPRPNSMTRPGKPELSGGPCNLIRSSLAAELSVRMGVTQADQ